MNISNNTTTINVETDSFEQFTKGLYVYGIPIICIFGIVGNILSFKVFVFTSFGKYSSSIYIAALSLSDTVFLWSLLLSWLGNGRIGVYYGHYPVWCHLMIYVTYVCSFLSVWYVVLIMVDRYIVVCHSLHVPNWCSKTRARVATGTVSMFGILLYAHTFFTADVMGKNCSIQPKPFMIQIVSIVIYVDTAITFVIPFAIIFILNIIVLYSIRTFRTEQSIKLKDRNSSKASKAPANVLSKAQYRITRTFILVALMLLVTNVPSHGIRFYIIIKSLIQEENSVLAQAQHICQIVYYTNFATNFLLYSVSSRLFRKYLSCTYLCCCLCRRRRGRDRNYLYQ